MTERDQVVEILRKAISPPFKAVMGRGDGVVNVTGRPGYVWCRKLGKTEMLMEAYNRGAPAIEDVIVLVQESRIEGVKGYEVIGVASSTSPGNYYPEVPPHAWTHEWRPGIGRDRVTVYPRAWGYLRAEPIATGSMNVWVTPGWYYYNDFLRWYVGGYSPAFYPPPSGTWNQLLSFEPSDESLHISNGSIVGYGLRANIPTPSGCTYPIATIESTGTFSTINENMIEDVRLFMDPIEDCAETGTFAVHDHEDVPGGGQLDHGLAHVPASLLDDDHTIYLKERASGGLAAEIPLHKDEHDPQTGADPLDCGIPTTILAQDTVAAESATDEFARSEHVHGLDVGVPSNIGVANAEGASTEFARKDHVHDHPALTIEPFDAHLNNPTCRVYRSTAQSIPNDIGTAISFSHERWDTDSIWAIGDPTKLICKTVGYYLVVGHLRFAANAAGIRIIQLWKNDPPTIVAELSRLNISDVDGVAGGVVTSIVSLAVNDFMRLAAHQDRGGALNVISSAEHSPEFMMVRVG